MKFQKTFIAAFTLLIATTAVPFNSAHSSDDCKDKKTGNCGGLTEAEKNAYEKMTAIGDNHKLLGYMDGKWNAKTTHLDDAQNVTETSEGKCITKSIMGGRFYQSDFKGSMMGQPFEGMAVTGYDNLSGKFVGTWIDNFSTHLSFSSGAYDPAAKTFTYLSSMDDPKDPGKTCQMKEVIKVVDKDKHVMTFYLIRDKKESKFMEIVYDRAES